jgi:hypothetical protein
MSIDDERRRQRLLAALKPQVDTANVSTVCEKRELNLPMGMLKIRWPGAIRTVLQRMVGEWQRGLP